MIYKNKETIIFDVIKSLKSWRARRFVNEVLGVWSFYLIASPAMAYGILYIAKTTVVSYDNKAQKILKTLKRRLPTNKTAKVFWNNG